MNIKPAFLSILSLLFSACLFAQTQESEVRQIGNFTALNISAPADVVFQKGESPSIKIVSKGFTPDEIITEVKGDELTICLNNSRQSCNNGAGDFFRGIFSSSKKKRNHKDCQLTAYVTYTQLKKISVSSAASVSGAATKVPALEISVSGAASVKITDVETDELALSVSGASDLKLSGKSGKTTVEASGASSLEGYNLLCKSATIQTSGASDVNLSVENELETHATGSSSVCYKGNPAKIISDASAGSSISRLNK